MSKADSQQAAGAEPVEGAKTTAGSLQGNDRGAPAGWEGYSPETLAALLDE
jgi:hypothetical protein